MGTSSTPPPKQRQGSRGGRGARERIIEAASTLFYEEGIHATGVARLTDAAHVSTRTFYQHFPSKNDLVIEYLRHFDGETPPPTEQQLDRTELTPRERLLAIFTEPSPNPRLRGCPFHNAAVESAGAMPDVAELAERHKQSFIQRIADVAAQAGAGDPEKLGRQLGVLFEGATALATSLNDPQAIHDAHDAAEALINAEVPA